MVVSRCGLVAGTVLGAAARFGMTFSEVYGPGWLWWFEHGLHAAPGTAGFAGFVDNNIYRANEQNMEFCVTVALFPGLIGGMIGAASGATGRPILGAFVGGLMSGIAILLMRLPELYRPGWFGKLWLDYNVPMLVESACVGAAVGAVAGGIGLLCNRRSASAIK